VAEADLLHARAQLDQARTQLSRSVLRAPVTGIVTDRHVEPGETVSAGTTLLTLVAPRNLRVKADIDEANLHDIRVGQRAVVSLDAFPGLKLDGRVSEIVPSADNTRGTVEVRIALDTPSEKLLPQLTTDINIVIGTYKDALTLPRETIQHPDGKASVLVVKAGKVVEQAVSVVGGEAGRMVMTSGVDADAEVIAAPETVKVGDAVEAIPAKMEGRP
jgi:HlyD family secretion protein